MSEPVMTTSTRDRVAATTLPSLMATDAFPESRISGRVRVSPEQETRPAHRSNSNGQGTGQLLFFNLSDDLGVT